MSANAHDKLHEYLGMTRDEYNRFARNSSELPKGWKEVTK